MLNKIVDARVAAEENGKTRDELEVEIMAMKRVFIYVRGNISSPFRETSRKKSHKYKYRGEDGNERQRSLGYDWLGKRGKKDADRIEPLPFYEMELSCRGSEMWNILVSQRDMAQAMHDPIPQS